MGQTAVTSEAMRMQALQEIRSARKAAGVHRRPGLDFLVLALSGKKALTQTNFDKVIGMIDTMVTELLAFAKNRRNKFYNPDLYGAPPKRELSAGDRIYENMGGELTTAAPGGIANTGIAVLAEVANHDQGSVAPPPPPATWGAYSKKSEESNGVIGMIDLLIKDLDKEMTEAKTEEKDAQADYETMMKESGEKRVADSKSLADKQSAKADTEKALADLGTEKKDTVGELFATLKYIQSLHTECDWLKIFRDEEDGAHWRDRFVGQSEGSAE